MSQLRVGLIGCGRVVERFHLPALLDNPQWVVAAAADVNQARRSWFQSQMGGVPVFGEPEQMLDRVALDAALVAATPDRHADLAVMALERGINVLLEKPGGTSLTEARTIAAAAELAKRHLWVSFNRRFMSNYQAMALALRGLRQSPAVRGRFALSFNPLEWDSVTGHLTDVATGGGVLLDVASHQMDALGWLSGRTVCSLRVLDWSHAAGQEQLRYAVELSNGWSIDCLARHGPDYREHMLLEWEGGRATLFPTGIYLTSRLPRSFHAAIARGRHWLDRNLIRLGLARDVMADSFHRQWQAFARAIQAAGPADGETWAALLSVHAGLEAIRKSHETGFQVALPSAGL
jgi:predicted dehydrogenase